MDETISISTLKDFELLKQIGKGSFGVVYRVKRKRDGQIYAMKCINISKMDKKSIENCLTEIRILCSVSHPNVVGYKEAFLDKVDTELDIVMEYVGGGDLASKINQCSKRRLLINEQTIWKYFCQTLLGLKALHSMKIIHRDIKSANLFLSEDFETIKLGDLNVAKIAKNDLASTQIGTPYYLAPEIWKNEVYSYKCDVFSLGCVLYEMAALRVPFEGTSLQDLYKKITRGIINKIPKEYSEDLYTIIKLCLVTDPKQRPTVAQLLDHPTIIRQMSALNINLHNDQIKLDKLMNTIKVDKNYQNKIKIALPNNKRYRTRSADNFHVKVEEEPRKPLVETKEPVNPSPVISRPSIQSNSQKKIAVINPLERVADQDKNGPLKPTVKLPPIKTNAKVLPPAPIQTKIPVQQSPVLSYQRENIPVRDPSSRNIPEDRDNSLSKNQTPHSRKYHDYLEKLIEQNNQYLKEKSIRQDAKQQSRHRVSSADPHRDPAPYSVYGNQNKGARPVWWG
jgi:NIMA (never in mitosis gene a)-related kinase